MAGAIKMEASRALLIPVAFRAWMSLAAIFFRLSFFAPFLRCANSSFPGRESCPAAISRESRCSLGMSKIWFVSELSFSKMEIHSSISFGVIFTDSLDSNSISILYNLQGCKSRDFKSGNGKQSDHRHTNLFLLQFHVVDLRQQLL